MITCRHVRRWDRSGDQMARKNDDIFRQLKKQKPLVKRKDIQPLSSGDFSTKRSSFDMMVEEKAKKSRVKPQSARPELNIFSGTAQKPASRSKKRVQGAKLADKYDRAKRTQTPPEKREPEIFASENAPAAKPAYSADKSTAGRKGRSDYASDAPPKESGISVFPGAARRPSEHQYETPIRRAAAPAVLPKGLAFRHELKYYINYRDYVLLRSMLRSLMSVDAYAGGDGAYHIRSLYFDDVYDSALAEKIAGSDMRSKYRIRVYNFSDDVIKFEEKIKRGEFIAKKSILLSRDEYERIIAGDYDFLRGRDEPFAQELYLQFKQNMLRPRVLVDYVREAYVAPIENVRITFDKNLRGGLVLADIFDPDAPTMPMYDSGMMVLEVKFNRYLPETIKSVLNTVNAAQRSAISKYVICRKFD